MRRLNGMATMCIMILFLVHLIWGGLLLLGQVKGGNPVFATFSYAMMVFICIHVLIGIKLTIDTIVAAKRSGVFYWKENCLFLLRRISGFALLIFIAVHFIIFSGTNDDGVYRLREFDMTALISQILMVLALFVHLITNITPLRITLGISDKRNIRTDIAIIVSILLLLSGVAFLIYYIRWQVI